MRTRTYLTAATVVAVGALLGWLTASGRFSQAQEQAAKQANHATAGSVLPVPPAPFQGTIDLRAKDSKSDFPQPVQAPKGAPNNRLGRWQGSREGSDRKNGADSHLAR